MTTWKNVHTSILFFTIIRVILPDLSLILQRGFPMKTRYHSIGSKLLYTLVAATTIPMLIYCFFFSYNMRRSAEDHYIEQTRHTWQIVASNIEHSLSTSIDAANQGIYLNSALQDLLFSRDPSAFSYAESANSSLLFSYMTNIYSLTPEATQIQFSAYKTDKSFLLTTKNLQKYIRNRVYEEDEKPPVPAFRAYIMPPHQQTSYGHQLSHLSISQEEAAKSDGRGDLVFTVCLPIYHLPNPNSPIGELKMDISMHFFEKVCNFLYDRPEQFYIVDSDYHIIFSSDASYIGENAAGQWIRDLVEQSSAMPDSFVSTNSGGFLSICQKIPGASYQWYMVKSIPEKTIYQTSNYQLASLLMTFGLCLLITILINGYSILHYTNPLKKATTYLNSINTRTQNLNSRLSEYVTYRSEDEIGILFRSLEEMMDTINNFVIRQYELEIINRTTELKILEAQINPHFIYNTLQCLATKSLEHSDREQYNYISSFGQLLQYAMDTRHTLVTVREELSHIDRYIMLQKMRFTSHLSVHFEADTAVKDLIVPKMILQPLIENSFKHGNLFKQEHGYLLIQASVKEDHFLHLYVIDNGRTPSEAQLDDINRRLSLLRRDYTEKLLTLSRLADIDGDSEKTDSPGADSSIRTARENLYATNNIGLTNVLLRLLLNFGGDCSMDLSANELGGTTVHLVISHETLWNEKQPTPTQEMRKYYESTDFR